MKKISSFIALHSFWGFCRAARNRILSSRAKSSILFKSQFCGGKGLEIGGPSRAFSERGIFPVYPFVQILDNVTYSSKTIWEGDISLKPDYYFHAQRKPGHQYIMAASDLKELDDELYDFVISCHVLEHLADPLKGLGEWFRVLKKEGRMVLVAPHKDGGFDHRRPVTSLSHLIDDFKSNRSESDITHRQEILNLHDLDFDDGVANREEFVRRVMANEETRIMHHHTFTTESLAEILEWCHADIISIEHLFPFHIVAVMGKTERTFTGKENCHGM